MFYGALIMFYGTLMLVLVALAISIVYENYVWSIPAIVGVVLIVSGNVLAMRR